MIMNHRWRRCGMTPDQLRHRIRPGGPWQRLLPGVYLTVTGTPTRRQYEIAALQCGGADSVLTGTAALAHHGIRVREGGPIIVLVPAGKIRQNRGLVRIWPTTRMPEFAFTDGAIRFAEAARAVAEAARELGSFRGVRAVAADAVQRRRCRIDQLAEELAPGRCASPRGCAARWPRSQTASGRGLPAPDQNRGGEDRRGHLGRA
jgi:hypothetical protein